MNTEDQRDKLGIEEFKSELLGRISRKIVSRTYLHQHEDFTDALIFDLFPNYLEGASVQTSCDIVESVFYNLFHFRPATENAEEIIDIDEYSS